MVNTTKTVELVPACGTNLDRVTHHLGNAAQIMCLMDCQGRVLEAKKKLLEAAALIKEAQNERPYDSL